MGAARNRGGAISWAMWREGGGSNGELLFVCAACQYAQHGTATRNPRLPRRRRRRTSSNLPKWLLLKLDVVWQRCEHEPKRAPTHLRGLHGDVQHMCRRSATSGQIFFPQSLANLAYGHLTLLGIIAAFNGKLRSCQAMCLQARAQFCEQGQFTSPQW